MATKIPDEFVPLYLGFPRDPAILRAGLDAELLYIRGLLYLKANLDLEGFIPDRDLPHIGSGLTPRRLTAATAALTRESLWVKETSGHTCRSWLKWNASKAEIKAKRQRKQIGAAKTNHTRGYHDTPDPDCPYCNGTEEAP